VLVAISVVSVVSDAAIQIVRFKSRTPVDQFRWVQPKNRQDCSVKTNNRQSSKSPNQMNAFVLRKAELRAAGLNNSCDCDSNFLARKNANSSAF
jgi:hypothetical protein